MSAIPNAMSARPIKHRYCCLDKITYIKITGSGFKRDDRRYRHDCRRLWRCADGSSSLSQCSRSPAAVARREQWKEGVVSWTQNKARSVCSLAEKLMGLT